MIGAEDLVQEIYDLYLRKYGDGRIAMELRGNLTDVVNSYFKS